MDRWRAISTCPKSSPKNDKAPGRTLNSVARKGERLHLLEIRRSDDYI
jgi:hypothetical protein